VSTLLIVLHVALVFLLGEVGVRTMPGGHSHAMYRGACMGILAVGAVMLWLGFPAGGEP
jgi:hypothetical protein